MAFVAAVAAVVADACGFFLTIAVQGLAKGEEASLVPPRLVHLESTSLLKTALALPLTFYVCLRNGRIASWEVRHLWVPVTNFIPSHTDICVEPYGEEVAGAHERTSRTDGRVVRTL